MCGLFRIVDRNVLQPAMKDSIRQADVEHAAGRIRVTAILRPHPTDRSKLERMASLLSVEKRVSSVS
ncbi:hypothetical protein [Paraburkholderia sp. DGU8]|uniref:hypothetical protein n=1 Tax=Paraburkholderia sp. DGU8 TaxID=3161997 RepID=UPI0034671770